MNNVTSINKIISPGITSDFQKQSISFDINKLRNACNEVLKIKGNEAIEMTKKLATDYGLFVGVSAGANVLASIIIAKRLNKGDKVVTILCDTGERYLSTGIFS